MNKTDARFNDNRQELSLPESCYSYLRTTGEVIIIARGEPGYYPTDFSSDDKEFNKQLVEEYNAKCGITKAQVAAMEAGSMFGWDVPGADPNNYDENGLYKKPTAVRSLSEQIAFAEQSKENAVLKNEELVNREESR